MKIPTIQIVLISEAERFICPCCQIAYFEATKTAMFNEQNKMKKRPTHHFEGKKYKLATSAGDIKSRKVLQWRYVLEIIKDEGRIMKEVTICRDSPCS